MCGGRWGRLLMVYPQCAIEGDNSVRLPATACAKVGQSPVLAPTLDLGLAIYSQDAWDDLSERRELLPDLRYEAKLLLRLVRSNASRAEFAQPGAIRIPPALQRLAHLAGDVLVVSAEDHIQLWNPEIWQSRESSGRLSSQHDVA